ncbi:hypothetical protein MTP16_19420 [Hymenobacter monticola]|uniref:Uncharacterized protein n=1 Tax=Hymenobacter monticola TaxID=1705399 RepID=A0ABY4B2E1_9BACT|nr:hypothetical protein [Hymenobacter monticola]UOE33282.1 hypothetical protein MTP16_19420 [Hymenobacter monticola]
MLWLRSLHLAGLRYRKNPPHINTLASTDTGAATCCSATRHPPTQQAAPLILPIQDQAPAHPTARFPLVSQPPTANPPHRHRAAQGQKKAPRRPSAPPD